MLSGATLRALAIAGTAVFKMVVSSDSMKNAMATSHGNNRLLDVSTGAGVVGTGKAKSNYLASTKHVAAHLIYLLAGGTME